MVLKGQAPERTLQHGMECSKGEGVTALPNQSHPTHAGGTEDVANH